MRENFDSSLVLIVFLLAALGLARIQRIENDKGEPQIDHQVADVPRQHVNRSLGPEAKVNVVHDRPDEQPIDHVSNSANNEAKNAFP